MATRKPWPGSPSTFSRRHPDVLEVEPAEVVGLQAHRVVALAHLEPVHALLEDQGDVLVLAVDLGAREGRDHVGSRAVADVALLTVQNPGAVGLLDRPGAQVVGVRPRLGLGQREGRQLAAGGEVGEEALLLLVGAEQGDALEADRLVDAEDDRQRRVDLADGLEDPGVAGLGEALPAVLLLDVEAERPDLAQVAEHLVGDPALLLGLPRVVVLGAVVADPRVQITDPVLLLAVGGRPGEDQLLVDLAEEERLGERGDALLSLRLPRDRFADRHVVRLPRRCADRSPSR